MNQDQDNQAEIKELQALAGEAAVADAQAAPTVAPDAVPLPGVPVVDRLAEAKMLIAIVRPLTELAVSYVKGAPESEWEGLNQPVADLLAYYDVDVSKWLASPWAALAFASAPLVMRGVNNWQESEKKQEKKKIPAPENVVQLAPSDAPIVAARG